MMKAVVLDDDVFGQPDDGGYDASGTGQEGLARGGSLLQSAHFDDGPR